MNITCGTQAGLALAMALSAAPALAQFVSCGDPRAGDCLKAHETPGCADLECCEFVCNNIDPICCELQWDALCAAFAKTECPKPPLCPGEGSCFAFHPDTTGCEDEACCSVICALDVFCCVVGWDQICVDEAQALCPLRPCELDLRPRNLPPGAIIEPELCGENFNGGCNLIDRLFTPIECGQTIAGIAWASQGPRDTDWYEITIPEPVELAITVSSEFPAQVFIVDGQCDTQITVIAQAYPAGCAPATATAAVEPGTYLVFIAPGIEGSPITEGAPCPPDPKKKPPKDPPISLYGNDYIATFDCQPRTAPCPADFNGNGAVQAEDLAVLLGAWSIPPGTPGCDGSSGGGGCAPDMNADGLVNAADLAQLLGAWGDCR